MSDTIPRPHPDEVDCARIGVNSMLDRAGFTAEEKQDPKVQALVENIAKVTAQLNAEVRWLRNMIHDTGKQ